MRRSELFFLLLTAAIPIQLNKFFFPEFSYVLGIPIDYRAIAIYFSDLLMIGYLLFFFLENRKNLKQIAAANKEFVAGLAILNVYLFISSIFTSVAKEASIVFNIKILMMSLFCFSAAISFAKSKVFESFRKVMIATLVWQSIIVIAQFIAQRSLGLWFLGERSFDAGTVNIAHIQIFGMQFLRPYGTFPHPNVAAAFFVLGLIIVWRGKLKLYPLSILAALILTGSKSAIFSLVLAAALSKLKYFWIGLTVALFAIWLFIKSITEFQVASIAERLILSQAALDIALNNILFGIGSNNFILELSKLNLSSLAQIRLLQPVHNIPLLILAENGLFGFLLFSALLISILRKAKSQTKLILFTVILIFASIDHFFWTLHQGQLLFFLSIAYIVSKQSKSSTI